MPTDSLNRQNFLSAESPLELNNTLLFPNSPSPFDLASNQALPRFGASSNSSLLNPPNGFESQSGFTSGYFTVGSTGQVGIDYLFDGGSYEGELGIFSLSGLEPFDPGSDVFIQEVVRRILSDSTLGHLVIDDHTDAARFTDGAGWEGNFNAGDYLGVKTVAMNPGDTFGVALLPNGSFRQILGNTDLWGNQRPLFSLATANPNQAFQFGQIADVTGNGSTFVLEDLSLDGTSDRDYNDVIFQVKGAIGVAASLDDVIAKDWRGSDFGQALLSYIAPYDTPSTTQPIDYYFPTSNQPLIGIIDTGFSANNPDIDYSRIILGRDYVDGDTNPLLNAGEGIEHGTHILGIIGATRNNSIGIDGINDQAPLWVGRAIGSGKWAESLVEFVDKVRESNQPNAVVNLSLDLTQKNPDGSITTRYEFTPAERAALEYARQSDVLIVAAAGNDGGVMSVLGQASQEFDNILTVGAADGMNRADYSSYGYGLDILAPGNDVLSTVGNGVGKLTGTSVATAEVTGAVSQVWAANPGLNYRQVIEILKATAIDLNTPGWDNQTGAGLANVAAAINLAKIVDPAMYGIPGIEIPATWSGAGQVIPTERAADGPNGSTDGGATTPTQIFRRPYIVRPGDTLQSIAQRELNNQGKWQEIQTTDGTFVTSATVPLQAGQLLYLPVNYQVGTGKPYNLMGGSSDPNLELSTIGDTTLPFFKNLGSTPSVVVTPGANPRVDVFVRGKGPEYSPYQRTLENGQWSAFNKLNGDRGGRLESDPLVVALSNGHQGMFVRGSGPDYALYYKESVDGQDWSASWTSLGGKVTSNPSVVVGDNGRIDVFVRGTGPEYPLYQMTFNGQNWGGWTLLGGRLSSDPVAVKGADGKIHVFVRGAGNKPTDSFSLYERTFNPQQNKWSAWTSRGGTLTSNPSVVTSPDGQIHVFARGTGPDYALYDKIFDGQQWQDWKNIGVKGLTSDPVAVISDDGRINVFFQQNGYIAQKTSIDGQIWSSVNIPSPAATSDPAVVASGNGRIDLAFREADYSLRYMRSLDNGATWVASADLGGTLSENPFYLGLGSDRPWLFESAFNRYGLSLRNFQPEDAVYRSGSGWIQNFTNATEKVVLMLRDGASFAYAIYGDYLTKYNSNLGYPTSEEYSEADGTSFINFEDGRIARKDSKAEALALGEEPSWRNILQPLLSDLGLDYFNAHPDFYTTGNRFWRNGNAPVSLGNNNNTGTAGNCTWYAFGRAKELGGNENALTEMSKYGDAGSWHYHLAYGARLLDSSETPQIGDIVEFDSGHVAVVESVSGNTVRISESSYPFGSSTGYLHHATRTISRGENGVHFIRVPKG